MRCALRVAQCLRLAFSEKFVNTAVFTCISICLAQNWFYGLFPCRRMTQSLYLEIRHIT